MNINESCANVEFINNQNVNAGVWKLSVKPELMRSLVRLACRRSILSTVAKYLSRRELSAFYTFDHPSQQLWLTMQISQNFELFFAR